MKSATHTGAETMTRAELFDAENVDQLFALLGQYLQRNPTAAELRTWTNTVLGPWHIEPTRYTFTKEQRT